MPNITLSIPHQLSREEAKQRVTGLAAQMRQQFGSVGKVTESWDGNKLNFTIGVTGMTVTGNVSVEISVVRIEVALPAALAMLAGGMKQTLEQEARKRLEKK